MGGEADRQNKSGAAKMEFILARALTSGSGSGFPFLHGRKHDIFKSSQRCFVEKMERAEEN